MKRFVSIGAALALAGGAAWSVKAGLIILMNDHFQPMEGVLYFMGVGGILVGAFAFGAFIAGRWSGAMFWLGLIIVTGLALSLTAVASSILQTAVRSAYTGSNVGMQDEIGILVPGLIWLSLGTLMVTRGGARPGVH